MEAIKKPDKLLPLLARIVEAGMFQSATDSVAACQDVRKEFAKLEAENTKLREALIRAIQLANTFKGKVCSMNLSEESYDGFDLARTELRKLESALQSESDKPTGKESQS